MDATDHAHQIVPAFRRRITRRVKTYLLQRRRKAAVRKRANGKGVFWSLLMLLALLLTAFAWSQSYLVPRSPGRQISLNELRGLASAERVPEAVFQDEDNRLIGTYSAAPVEGGKEISGNRSAGKQDGDKRGGKSTPGGKVKERSVSPPDRVAPEGSGSFWVSYPKSDAAFTPLFDSLNKAGADVVVDPQSSKAVVRAVSTYLIPLLILASFFGLLFAGRSGSSGIGQVMSFGTIGGKGKGKKGSGGVTFADVGGAEEAVAELSEVVDYLENPDRYDDIGAIPPKGVLLFGPPGCGKTLLAKAVAGEAGVPFFSVAGAEFVESLVGVGAARVRDLFARVRAVAPAIVFIDELDAAGRRRGSGGSSGGSDEREQTLNQLLVEMDGFEVGTGIVVIGATNRPDILDPALLRPGRFDRHITVDQPDADGRTTILRLHADGKPIDESVDFDYIARRTPGFSGADLANVINEAALLTLRERKPTIETDELQEAIQRVLHGPKRRGRVLSHDERSRAAYHESGHTVVAAALGEVAEIHRVTILLRARGLGSTAIERDNEALLLTRTGLYSKLIKAMGGLAAEELVFGEPSTGAEQDIEEATELARDIVGRYGMSPVIGRTRLLVSDVDAFLGGETGVGNVSPFIHEEFDHQVKSLIDRAELDAFDLLTTFRGELEEIANLLMVEETLEGKRLADALRGVVPVGDRIGNPFQASSNGSRSSRPSRAVASSQGEIEPPSLESEHPFGGG